MPYTIEELSSLSYRQLQSLARGIRENTGNPVKLNAKKTDLVTFILAFSSTVDTDPVDKGKVIATQLNKLYPSLDFETDIDGLVVAFKGDLTFVYDDLQDKPYITWLAGERYHQGFTPLVWNPLEELINMGYNARQAIKAYEDYDYLSSLITLFPDDLTELDDSHKSDVNPLLLVLMACICLVSMATVIAYRGYRALGKLALKLGYNARTAYNEHVIPKFNRVMVAIMLRV